MASVRLSQELRTNIQRASKAAYNKATPVPTMDAATIETIWRGIVEHPTHIALTNFVAEHGRSMDMNFGFGIGPRTDDIMVVNHASRNIRLKLPTSRKSWIHKGYSSHNTSLEQLHLTAAEKLDVADKLEKLVNDQDKAAEDETNYNRQIKDLLESCNTLKQLLDTQPSMKEFVPEHLIRDMHKKVTRESQARERREIAKVDGDLINRVVLTSKLVA